MAQVDRSAFEVVDLFESRMAEYCGAPYAISVDSCTNALYLCFERLMRERPITFGPEGIELPRFTYVGVAQAARRAGFLVDFIDRPWVGEYCVEGTRIWDSARWLRRDMYIKGTLTCLSFHATKHLPIGRGGAILCDDEDDADWFRKARFDGRDMHASLFDQEEFGFGIHAYMPPDAAARGLWLMQGLKDHNDPIPGEYPDLSKKEWK